VLACTAAGLLDTTECIRLQAEREIDAPLRDLAMRAAQARRRGDRNYLVRRGAMLQTDIAVATADALRPVEDSALPGAQPVRVHMVDGEAAGVGAGDVYWAIARDLVDAVTPRPDEISRLWYIATNAWMQNAQQYNPAHLKRARDLFPDDAMIALLSGTQAEAYASPPIQSVVRTAVLPTGFVMEIGSEGAELKAAETFLQRAVRLDPSSDQAHLHLGHVLLARGRAQDAVSELTAARTTPDPLLRYYADMFLGAAEEALGHADAARPAYVDAATLFPRAQSPALALGALETRQGNRVAAARAIAVVFNLPQDAESRDDPWWRYRTVQGRDADERLAQLRERLREAGR